MQCRNCRFQNMPGTQVCGRCGTSLGLAAAVFDINPPRAGRWIKRFRRVFPTGQRYYRSRDALAQAGSGAAAAVQRVAPPMPALPSGPVAARLIIPGWSHFYVGQRLRGRLALWSWLACLIPGLFWFGTTAGSILIGLAFSVHSSAALDSFIQLTPNRGVRDRMTASIGLSVVLFFALYWPAGWLITRVADPRVILQNDGTFEEGNVVLVNHWKATGPGSVVLYAIPEQRIAQGPMFRERAYLAIAGERVDRILASPGDNVRWADGRLTVNGAPSPLLPLDPRWLPGPLAFSVPAGHFLILPSTTPQLQSVHDASIWQTLSLVPAASIEGRVYVRSHPLRRFRLIR